MQVNCVWDLFICEMHVKLPAFAGNFARACFTVYRYYEAKSVSRVKTNVRYGTSDSTDFVLTSISIQLVYFRTSFDVGQGSQVSNFSV